ncbi:MAG TPA: MFS transporter [Alphaproteobacteria bacterium]|nr:MFS transporter [Alphaproteobacteria bacterium]
MPDSKTTPAWRRPEVLLLVAAAASPLAWATWSALLNNFVIEQAAFTGREIGILQSLREVPGFLAFAVVFLLLMIREQRLMYLSLVLLGVGTAITGFFPDALGLYVTTMIMSLGFHYFETVKDSLALQWLRRDQAAHWLGRLISVGSFASLVAFCLIWMAMKLAGLDFVWIYAIGGGATVVAALWLWAAYPLFPQKVEQHKRIILRPRYWLYYALTFAAGARRQIFVVFAAFLLVEKFGLDASTIAIVFLINGATTVAFAPQIGKWIGRWGERKALTFEYVGLILVFTAYAFVDSWWLAVGLYVIDHLLFAMAIAMKTYIQKIADPADIAPTAGVSFTINHIAAVVLPAVLGLLWLVSPAAVFLAGAAMAAVSLALARLVPKDPDIGNEVALPFRPRPLAAPAAE